MQTGDQTRLLHMRDAAEEAASFTQSRKRVDLETDRMLLHALVRCLEIIGEAANGVGEDIRQQYPEIPWSDVVGMRNRLIHGYFDIDHDRVWDTVTDDLPALIDSLRSIPDLS